jgi:pimeloyl-ACP methyl ester carboxylesterase
MSRPAQKSVHAKATPSTPPETVSGRWLLKAIGVVILVALICSYLSLCLLFYQGQWQMVLHPDASAKTRPAPAGLLRFAPDESGRPQLTGEWLGAAPGGRYAGITVLFLGGGDGSRANSAACVAVLHDLGLNVLSFDYRGYGLSTDIHPNQQRLMEDSQAAWRYLTGSRGIAGKQIVLYGTGVGASLATLLAAEHPETPALILETPYADLLEVARADSRSSLLPVAMLFHERFPLAGPLATLGIPKLLIAADSRTEPSAFVTAASPKITVTLPPVPGALYSEAVTRFLDQYVAAPGSELVPSVAPAGTKLR